MDSARVIAAPAKSLLIYDGDCNFCKFWVLRWQRATKGRVDFLPFQDPRVPQQFPELPPERFDKSVQFIETDGTVYGGAEAVFRSLTYSFAWGWLFWLYQTIPGFAPVTEWAYGLVARNRMIFSMFTRLLWGREGALPTYSLVRSVFIRWMGVIYLSAFFSLTIQMDGLLGRNGITPAQSFMQAVRLQCDQNQIGWSRYHLLPTLCWLNAQDGFLHLLCGTGCVLSVLVIFDVAPAFCLFLLWAIYLSLSAVGNVFLMFQWDALLLETGFLAIFFAPLQIFPRRTTSPAPSPIVLWLLRWLLFRLMFESGLVKWVGGDATWLQLRALNFHYETQPLPTWVAWYAHQLPGGFQKFCVFMVFVIELAVPFLIFAPRRLRFLGCGLLVFLQVCIMVTGNYCFFNLLTLGLCLLLLDDAALLRFVPKKFRARFMPEKAAQIAIENTTPDEQENKTPGEIKVPATPPGQKKLFKWPWWIIAPIAAVVLLVSSLQLVEMTPLVRPTNRITNWPGPWPWLQRLVSWEPFFWLQGWVAPFESINHYGLFQMMTTSRPEITVEGSNDGTTWLAYEFRYKPGDPKQRPGFVAPHQPRLDWQMWFAALGDYRQNPWFVNFCFRLLKGTPEVAALLAKNPFPNAPPKYIRAQVYDYHFSNYQQRRAEGVWWKREYKGEYLPVISLEDFRESPRNP